MADIYVPVAGVSWKKSVHSTSSSARMKNLAAALLLLAARADTFSALSKTTYSEGGGGLHPDTIAWQQHLGLTACSPGDLIKGRCGNVGDVAAYIEANREAPNDGDGPQRTSGRRAEEAARRDG